MDFVIINDVRQRMALDDPNGPWIHHATVMRGFKEYIIFRHKLTGKVYLEQVESHRASLVLQLIEDSQEWQDLHDFAKNAGLLSIAGEEIKVANVDK